MPESKFCLINPHDINGKPDGFQGKKGNSELKNAGNRQPALLREPGPGGIG
jgi:hypothetical protein